MSRKVIAEDIEWELQKHGDPKGPNFVSTPMTTGENVKIPGLDDALQRLDRMQDDMIPLLQRIADGVDELVRLTKDANGISTQ